MLSTRALILSLILGLGSSVLGQTVGGVKGTVTDPGKGLIVNARVYIENTGFQRTLISNDDGEYSCRLPDGEYRIRVKQDGFKPSKVKRIRIRSNRTVEVNFVLVGIVNDPEHP